MRFNAPPGWPVPPTGWTPPPGWQPDPSWPAAPAEWRWWVEEAVIPHVIPPSQNTVQPWQPFAAGPSASPAPAVPQNPYGLTAQPVAQQSFVPQQSFAQQSAPTPATTGSLLDEQLVRLGRWRARRGTEDMPVLTATGPDPAAKWFGVASSVARLAPVASALPGGDHVLEVVKALYDIEDEQVRVLHSIDANVRLLKEGPFKAGRLLLSEAHRIGDRDDEGHRLLESAKDRFYDAQPLASSVQERAMVEMHLGLVWLALGRAEDARYWLEQGYQSARVVIEALVKQAGNVKVLKSKWATTALSIYYPAGLLVVPLKLKRVWSADKASTALNAFLPFANTIASCLNTLSPRPVVPILALTRAPGGERMLQEMGMEG